jgi:hypothetical protein
VTVVDRVTTLDASIGGSTVANAFAARASLGYDMSYGTASIDIAGEWPGGNFGDQVDIFVMGEHWFSGVLAQVDYTLYPRQITAQARGRMSVLSQVRPPGEINPQEGFYLDDFVGGPASDEAIVSAVLDIAGVNTNGGNIGGTGITLGTIAPEEFAWKSNENALSYIQRIDQISLGYRTFESTGGSVFRSQVSTLPDSGSDFTFTEGEDIVSASNTRSTQEAYDTVRVSGYAIGDFFDPRIFVVGGGTRLFEFSSPMIERRAESSAGEGISCEALANYWLNELDRVLVKLRMTTPRNDNIGPGQVHNIQASTRLGQSGNLWVQRVDKEYASDGRIAQTMTYVGAG